MNQKETTVNYDNIDAISEAFKKALAQFSGKVNFYEVILACHKLIYEQRMAHSLREVIEQCTKSENSYAA